MRVTTRYRSTLTANRHSEHRTHATIRFDIHYAKIALIERWDWKRFIKLSVFLRLTPYELGSLIALPHAHVNFAQRDNHFSGPAALILTLLEAQVMSKFTNDVIANPLPVTTPPNDPPQGS